MKKQFKRATFFSSSRTYRYALWRDLGGMPTAGNAIFIGLNPSTAN